MAWVGILYVRTYIRMYIRTYVRNSQSTFDVPTYVCTYMHGVHTYVGDMLSTCMYDH